LLFLSRGTVTSFVVQFPQRTRLFFRHLNRGLARTRILGHERALARALDRQLPRDLLRQGTDRRRLFWKDRLSLGLDLYRVRHHDAGACYVAADPFRPQAGVYISAWKWTSRRVWASHRGRAPIRSGCCEIPRTAGGPIPICRSGVAPGRPARYRTRLRWLKLGQARERVFELTTTDPVKRTIIAANGDGYVGT
jgi:hypothetical protein